MSVVEFQVIGRKKPTATELHPKIYRMRLFAPNDTIAKSRFWYFMTKLNKIRGSQGEILAVNKVSPLPPTFFERIPSYFIFHCRILILVAVKLPRKC